MRLIIGLFLTAILSGQVVYDSVRVNRVYNIIGEKAIDNREETKRRMNAHTFYCAGSGTWSCQIQYSDVSASGPWTNFGDASSLVDNNSTTPNGSGFGYHDFIRIDTTGTVTRVDYAGMLDIFFGGAGGRVSSVFGRTGAITAQSGDYSAYYSLLAHLHAGTYEPVDATILRSGGSYSNPTWLPNTPTHSSGSGVPTSTPAKVGDTYTDTDENGSAYTAFCTTSSACWKPNGSGGVNPTISFTSQTLVNWAHNTGVAGGIIQCRDTSGNLVGGGYNTADANTAVLTYGVAQSALCTYDIGSGTGGSGGGSTYTLPAPTTTEMGGVKRNLGSTGQYVTGIAADGSLEYATPEGTGTGGTTYTAGTGISISGSVISLDGAVAPMILCVTPTPGAWSSIASKAHQTQTVTASGFIDGDVLLVGPHNTLADGLITTAKVTSANNVAVTIFNATAGALTPGTLPVKLCTVRTF